jgi:hypothetical protein
VFFSAVHLHGGPAPVRRFLPELVDLIWSRQIDPGKVFDLTLPLDQAAEGYQAMDERRAIKTLLRPWNTTNRTAIMSTRRGTPIDGGTPMRRTASTLSIVIGSLLIIGGVATWIVVSNTLADQKITVSDDASCLAGDEVDGPFSAYCEAMVIDKHALEATGGLRYAELDRDDPKRQTAQTASFLQASLFTSVVAFGVAAMAIAIGVLFILIGLGMRDVASRTPGTT